MLTDFVLQRCNVSAAGAADADTAPLVWSINFRITGFAEEAQLYAQRLNLQAPVGVPLE